MGNEVTSPFREHIEETGAEFEEYDIGNMTLEQLMSDYRKLLDYYIQEQVSFRRIFGSLEISKKILIDHQSIFQSLLQLSNEEKQTNFFGKYLLTQQINTKISENYDKIIQFLQFCTEIRNVA